MLQSRAIPGQIQRHSSVHLRDACLQTTLCLHSEMFTALILSVMLQRNYYCECFMFCYNISPCCCQDVARFTFVRFEEGKEKCPYDPKKSYTGFMIGAWFGFITCMYLLLYILSVDCNLHLQMVRCTLHLSMSSATSLISDATFLSQICGQTIPQQDGFWVSWTFFTKIECKWSLPVQSCC